MNARGIKKIHGSIQSKKVAIEICQHIPEKVEQLKNEVAELEQKLDRMLPTKVLDVDEHQLKQ